MLLSWFISVRDREHLWSSLPLPPSAGAVSCREGCIYRNVSGLETWLLREEGEKKGRKEGEEEGDRESSNTKEKRRER